MTGLVVPPIPDGLCGNRGCVFTAGHLGEHSWARRWGERLTAIAEGRVDTIRDVSLE